jgi:hypothetical protein
MNHDQFGNAAETRFEDSIVFAEHKTQIKSEHRCDNFKTTALPGTSNMRKKYLRTIQEIEYSFG